jgi:hypothetical protein
MSYKAWQQRGGENSGEKPISPCVNAPNEALALFCEMLLVFLDGRRGIW